VEFKRWKNLSEILLEHVEKFCNDFNEREEILTEIEDFASRTKTPILLPSAAAFLRLIIKLLKPEKVLEIGTGIGYSTLNVYFSWPEAEIVTVDSNKKRLEVAERFFKRAGAPIKTVCADGFDVIRKYLCDGISFNFVLIDSTKSEYPFFHYKVQALLEKGGMAVFDNVLFRGYVSGRNYDSRYERGVELLKFFLQSVRSYPGFENLLLPLGDGLLILFKKTN